MSYKIKSITPFDRQLKRLAKKFPSLKNEIAYLFDELENDPMLGIPMGMGCYKIRLAIASKGKGKSGGARVITNVLIRKETVYLLSIYDKSEQPDISDSDLKKLIEMIIS